MGATRRGERGRRARSIVLVCRRSGSSARAARYPRSLAALLGAVGAAACAAGSGSSALGGPGSKLATFARGVNILPASPRACPGDAIAATYEVRLAGGTVLPLTERDVADLHRRGVAAEPARNGGWQTSADALASASSGFRLVAELGGDSTVRGDTVVAPAYRCRRQLWGLGPTAPYADRQAHVRLRTLATPFYDSVVVAVFEVPGRAPAVTILGPGDMKHGAIRVDASGAAGTRGRAGRAGENGSVPCTDGGDGEDGDPGEDGKPGGQVDIIVQAGVEWLADLVSVSNPGGRGGQGGAGGMAGRPGAVARDPSGRPCSPKPGRPGRNARDGESGPAGLPPRVTTVPLTLLWPGSPVWADSADRAELEKLIEYTVKKGG